MVRKLSRKTRRLQVVMHAMKRKTVGCSRLDWTHCVTSATRKHGDRSSTVAQHSWHARRSSAQETTTRPTPRTTLFRAVNGAMVKRYGERIIRLQRQGTSMDVNFQVADVHRPTIPSQGLDGDLLRSRILPKWSAHQTGRRRWTLEHGREKFFLAVDPLHDMSNT